MSEKLENAIIINGRVYELVEDREGGECDRCALAVDCDCNHNPICVFVFGDADGKRFDGG